MTWMTPERASVSKLPQHIRGEPSSKISASGPMNTMLETNCTEICHVYGPDTRQNCRRGSYLLPLVWRGSLERQVPDPVSPSSSEHGLKCRGPFLNVILLLQNGTII
ncbi:hypothetical protein AVEN_265367-1 [Araneus ventricosus]|uniref:Uncharacterized protein n=1 Tax=Araneus ventricosus TaxID=182803 RepID=A0A4Y2MAB0_ARAVE|nr:hypothetical protein AVEN_265367-1 [Araneus ventricosus]